jgi:tetratricopeptide (TPR) repeat protein
LPALGVLFLALTSFAQTTTLEGDVKGEDGQPLKGAQIKIVRKDMRGNYKVKTDKKGHFLHAGLPSGTYTVTLEVDGKDVDMVDNLRTSLSEPAHCDFDLQARKKKTDELQKAAETGQLSEDQKRAMTPEAREAMEKALKAREEQMKKNKALSDTYNIGMEALNAKDYSAATENLEKAAVIDPKQHVIWAHLADAYIGLAGTKTGADQAAAMQKGLEDWQKALEIKPDEAPYHNNYAIALVKAGKIPDAQTELNKAAQLDPPNAGQYYYNLGAILTNSGQGDAAADAFKKAAELGYAEAYYQYGLALVGKATIDSTGKMIPPAGTKEAFDKYLELKPTGPNADSAKAMLATMNSTVDTSYKNPNAPPPAAEKKGKKK